jgi:tight adherence protein B
VRLRGALLAVLAGALALAAGSASAAPKLAPVTRLPFPERGYVISVPEKAELTAADVKVRENGLRVDGVRVDPLARSGLRYGVVLALDASESMTGAPATAALESARTFVAHRADGERIGIVAFNGAISVVRTPTTDDAALERALATPPALAYGTRIHDALLRSLGLLRTARLSSGSIVLLSDGADIGSTRSLAAAIAAAKEQQVRIFTVGLRSGAFDPAPLRSIAEQTGGSYAEARSTAELAAIYERLGAQLAGEYLVRYRSNARPMSRVDVTIDVGAVGKATSAYVAPTPSLLPPYHRPAIRSFLLSDGSVVVIGLAFALLVSALFLLVLRGPRSGVVARVESFASGARSLGAREPAEQQAPRRRQYAGGWWAGLEQDLELARMSATPRQVMALALAGSGLITFLAVVLSIPLLAGFALTTPLAARAVVRRKVKAIRAQFADQFPSCLQVLASALRAGHSFNGALGVVVENSAEPARAELARVVQDDRLGVLPEVAIRRLARRMANRDIEQVALLAELQRTMGGNSAEILDTVVATIRERSELRRLVRTLTAQGRMARWILTALPVALTAFLFVVHPDVMTKFFASGGGQAALVAATAMVIAGSVVIQRIVDIEI